MRETKLTVPVPRDLLEDTERYAAENNTTLTDLIIAFLRGLPAELTLEDAPIVRRLAGTLPPKVGLRDYSKHVDGKYGQ